MSQWNVIRCCTITLWYVTMKCSESLFVVPNMGRQWHCGAGPIYIYTFFLCVHAGSKFSWIKVLLKTGESWILIILYIYIYIYNWTIESGYGQCSCICRYIRRTITVYIFKYFIYVVLNIIAILALTFFSVVWIFLILLLIFPIACISF